MFHCAPARTAGIRPPRTKLNWLGWWTTLFGAVVLGAGYGFVGAVVNRRFLTDLGAKGPSMVGIVNAIYGLGAIVGPFLSSVIIDKFGPQAFFVYIATVHAVLILFVLWRMTRRAAVPPKLRRRYVGLLRTSPMFVRLAMGRRRWHS